MVAKNGAAIPNLLAKAEGALLGAAVGDALGWPQEQRSSIKGGRTAKDVPPRPAFRGWTRVSGPRFARYEEMVRAGEYSDDTQLLLSVARACLSPNWADWLTHVELPMWPLYQRGGGRAVLHAAHNWAEADTAPWVPMARNKRSARGHIEEYFARGANGVAMRIAPHVIITANDETHETVLQRVVLDGIYTHGHPRALIGALIHALALRFAIRVQGTMGYDDLVSSTYSELCTHGDEMLDLLPSEWQSSYEATTGETALSGWRQVVDETKALYETALQGLKRGAAVDDQAVLDQMGCFDPKRNGAGHITAVAAAYIAARSATRPLSGLLLASHLRNADTDTLASMAATLLGALHGEEWMHPLNEEVQDSAYLRLMADCLVDSEKSRPNLRYLRDSPPVTRRSIQHFTTILDRGDIRSITKFPDGREVQVQDREYLSVAERSHGVTRWRLLASDGQSLIVDRPHRETSTGSVLQAAQPRQTISESLEPVRYKQESLFAEFPDLDMSIYDPSGYDGEEELARTLSMAWREIRVREDFKQLHAAAISDPMVAVMRSRAAMEAALTELVARVRNDVGLKADQSVFQGVVLSEVGLDENVLSRARSLWRFGASVAHGRTNVPNVGAARKYVDAVERVTIQIARFPGEVKA